MESMEDELLRVFKELNYDFKNIVLTMANQLNKIGEDVKEEVR